MPGAKDSKLFDVRLISDTRRSFNAFQRTIDAGCEAGSLGVGRTLSVSRLSTLSTLNPLL